MVSFVFFAGWLALSGVGFAQDQPSTPDDVSEKGTPPTADPTSDSETTTKEVASSQRITLLDDTAEVVEDPPPPTSLDKVDEIFATAVRGMEMVLFYRIGRQEELYVEFSRKAVFVRERGSKEPFQNVDPDAEIQSLSADDVQVYAARDQLVEGHMLDGKQRNYRNGIVDSKPVEYITVKLKSPNEKVSFGDTFVYDPEAKTYTKTEKSRRLLSDETVDKSTIEIWNKLGYLSLQHSNVKRPAYHLSRHVGGIPVVVAWLACGAVFFTLYMKGFNFWGFRHAVEVVSGKFDNPEETGEVTHFQALASALSATIGLGNIAGVTIAMTKGGPGAFFWMLLCGLFGMCTKFVECTLGQKYRHVKPDGTVLGGPMRYLKAGLDELNLGILGTVLSVVFTVMCILASFGGGNMYQANQAGSAMLEMLQFEQLTEVSEINGQIKTAAQENNTAELQKLEKQRSTIMANVSSFESSFKVIYGIILAALVGVVIIGGIKRIGAAAGKIVPTMCLVYVAACVYIIALNIQAVPDMIGLIFSEAFSPKAFGGGMMGVLVIGVQRAAFSNEAGAGSAAIAHSAAKTEEPVREGCVALLGPFIDTVVVCSMTALVILITGAWDNSEWIIDQGLEGSALTSRAFQSQISWFPMLLSVAVSLFAYSTIISWSYYGEKAWESLFGGRSTPVYKMLAVFCVFLGTIVNLGSVLDFSDMMILGMAFPNIAGVILLSPIVKRDLADYWKRYQAGEFKTYKS